MRSDAPREFLLDGNHLVIFEPPDFVHVVWSGLDDGPKHIYDFHEKLEALGSGRRMLVLMDTSNTRGLPSESRKAAVEDPRAKYIGALAILGAPFPVRVMVTMLHKAMRIIQKDNRPTAFFEDEASARVWLYAQRPMLARVQL